MSRSGRPISQIPQCIRQISHNAPFCNKNVPMVHCGMRDCYIVGFEKQMYSRHSGAPRDAPMGVPSEKTLIWSTIFAFKLQVTNSHEVKKIHVKVVIKTGVLGFSHIALWLVPTVCPMRRPTSSGLGLPVYMRPRALWQQTRPDRSETLKLSPIP